MTMENDLGRVDRNVLGMATEPRRTSEVVREVRTCSPNVEESEIKASMRRLLESGDLVLDKHLKFVAGKNHPRQLMLDLGSDE